MKGKMKVMKPQTTNENLNPSARHALRHVCLAACQKILARAKAAIFAEWQSALATQERLLRLALNEAEALAWQTQYPHLVFPELATEKAQAVAAWSRRQQLLRAA